MTHNLMGKTHVLDADWRRIEIRNVIGPFGESCVTLPSCSRLFDKHFFPNFAV